MKRLPCKRCHNSRLPDGKPYAMVHWMQGSRHIQYRCACGTVNRVTSQEFHLLPSLTAKELDDQTIVLWSNLDLPLNQQRDLKAYGFTPGDVYTEAIK